jgi:hypothetical protein
MINYRIVLGFAIFAFVISLLAGLIGGISFGQLVLRVLLGTAAFSLLGIGASWIIQKYLPELLQREASEKAEGDTSADEVDIVLPEENPHSIPEGEDETGLEEIEEDSQTDIEEDAQTDIEEDSQTDIEEAEPVEDDDETDLPSGLADLESVSGLDKVSEPPTPATPISELSPTQKKVNIMGVEQDPGMAAKAIRTWLKKDKEG